MDRPDFVYVIYITSTAEKVWQALTDPAFTRRYWGNHRNASDWKVGSAWRHEDHDDPSIVDIVGTVVESDPPRRLVVTWADPSEASSPAKVSRVTYDIVQSGDQVRLTLTHDRLDPGSNMAKGVSSGWPMVLSGLKTLLETGREMSPVYVREGKQFKRVLFKEAGAFQPG